MTIFFFFLFLPYVFSASTVVADFFFLPLCGYFPPQSSQRQTSCHLALFYLIALTRVCSCIILHQSLCYPKIYFLSPQVVVGGCSLVRSPKRREKKKKLILYELENAKIWNPPKLLHLSRSNKDLHLLFQDHLKAASHYFPR